MGKFKAAVNYYEGIIRRAGPGIEFPIRQLIGHRGQAPINVQSVAKDELELAAFLDRYPSIFHVSNNNVMLCNYWNDDYSTQRAVEYYSSVLMRFSPSGMLINSLFGHRGQAPSDVLPVVRNPLELHSFLLEYPETFRVEGNQVFLINPVGLKNETVDLSSPLRPQTSTGSVSTSYTTGVSDPLHPQTSNGSVSTSYSTGVSSPLHPQTNGSVSTSHTAGVHYYFNILLKISPNKKFPISRLIGHRGQATRDVKGIAKTAADLHIFLSNHPEIFIVTDDDCVLLKSTEINISSPAKSYEKSENANEMNITITVQFYVEILKDKGLNKEAPLPINQLIGYRSWAPHNVQNCARNEEELLTLLSSHPSVFTVLNGIVYLTAYSKERMTINKNRSCPPTISQNVISRNTVGWKDHVLSNTTIINDLDKCLHAYAVISKEKVIALSCQGYCVGNGIISIIQIGLGNGQVYIFDLLKDRNMVRHGGLKGILESNNIIKAVYFCRNYSVNLKSQFGVALKNVFDVNVAHDVIEWGPPTLTNLGPVGFNLICSKYGAPANKFEDEMKNVYLTEPDYWLKRPLTERMIGYATLDVALLVPRLYNEILNRLDDRNVRAAWNLSQKQCEKLDPYTSLSV